MQDTTQEAFRNFIPKLPKNRFRPRDLSDDRARRYNSTHSGINILNNHMLDRYLNNRNDLINMGVKVDG